jgi:hypothetical protein
MENYAIHMERKEYKWKIIEYKWKIIQYKRGIIKYEGHSKNTWTFVITNLFDVIL